MKIVTIVGARPQFIKAAVVSRALRKIPAVTEKIVHTGQHYDENMSDIFFRELEIPKPDVHLGVGSSSHGAQTAQMLEKIEAYITSEKPDWVLVYGDTNSTLAGSLAAVKLHVKLAHVEAGLRSFNNRMPEEINRILTDRVSDVLFVPTTDAKAQLLNEGCPEERIHWVGDVMLDCSLYYSEKAEKQSRILKDLNLTPKNFVLSTIHRAENTDSKERLGNILSGLNEVGREIPLVLPLHPRTRARLQNSLKEFESIRFIDPVGYLDMMLLEKNASAIATDSGGVQKEAFFFEVPCATLRDETEWRELVTMGWNRLIPPLSKEHVATGVREALSSRGRPGKPYGTGKSSDEIASVLTEKL